MWKSRQPSTCMFQKLAKNHTESWFLYPRGPGPMKKVAPLFHDLMSNTFLVYLPSFILLQGVSTQVHFISIMVQWLGTSWPGIQKQTFPGPTMMKEQQRHPKLLFCCSADALDAGSAWIFQQQSGKQRSWYWLLFLTTRVFHNHVTKGPGTSCGNVCGK